MGDEWVQHRGGQPGWASRRPLLRPELLPHRRRGPLRAPRRQRVLQQEDPEEHLAEEAEAGHRQKCECGLGRGCRAPPSPPPPCGGAAGPAPAATAVRCLRGDADPPGELSSRAAGGVRGAGLCAAHTARCLRTELCHPQPYSSRQGRDVPGWTRLFPGCRAGFSLWHCPPAGAECSYSAKPRVREAGGVQGSEGESCQCLGGRSAVPTAVSGWKGWCCQVRTALWLLLQSGGTDVTCLIGKNRCCGEAGSKPSWQ